MGTAPMAAKQLLERLGRAALRVADQGAGRAACAAWRGDAAQQRFAASARHPRPRLWRESRTPPQRTLASARRASLEIAGPWRSASYRSRRRQLDHERAGPREAVVLPVRRRAVHPRQANERQSRRAARRRAPRDARPPGADQRLGLLVKPDRHVRAQARGSGAARAGSRARRTAPGPSARGRRRTPIGRQSAGEVAVQVDAAAVEAGARARPSGFRLRDRDQAAADGRAAPPGPGDRVDPGALVAVYAAESQDQRTAGLDSTRAPDSVRSPARIGRPAAERPIVTSTRRWAAVVGATARSSRSIGLGAGAGTGRERDASAASASIKRADRPRRRQAIATATSNSATPAAIASDATVGELVPWSGSPTGSGATDAPTSWVSRVDRRHRLVPLGHGERRAGVRLEPEHVHVACGDVVEVDADRRRPPPCRARA